MRIIFIAKNQTGVKRIFNETEIEAWTINPNYTNYKGDKQDELMLIERIKLFAHKDTTKSHSCDFEWEKFTDTCFGHHAKSEKEFIKERTKNTSIEGYKVVSETNYNRYKKAILSIHNNYPLIDFKAIKEKPNHFSRQIL
ncbi:MAG: hypothetical protein V4538_02455 [Bacteroidota bacterium]